MISLQAKDQICQGAEKNKGHLLQRLRRPPFWGQVVRVEALTRSDRLGCPTRHSYTRKQLTHRNAFYSGEEVPKKWFKFLIFTSRCMLSGAIPVYTLTNTT